MSDPGSSPDFVILNDSQDDLKAQGERKESMVSTDSSVLVLDEDDDDSLKNKKNETEQQSASKQNTSEDTPTTTTTATDSSSTTTSFINDRAQLEKERLARLEQRKRQGESLETPSRYISRNQGPNVATFSSLLQQPEADMSSTSSNQTIEHFWNGEIRPIYNSLKPRDNSMTIEQVLGPRHVLKSVICSSFDTDLEFLNSLFPQSVQILVCMPSDGRIGLFSGPAYPNLRINFPKMDQKGAMHIKIFILFYDTFCRVIIPTANLRPHDWESLENTLFVQDFKQIQEYQESTFKNDLQDVLVELGVPENCYSALDRYDMRPADERYRIVASISGQYNENRFYKYGHGALSRALSSLGVQVGENDKVEAEYQGSSLGFYINKTSSWIAEFYCSLRSKKLQIQPSDAPIPPIKIIFPTLKTVKNSILGPNGAGTLFCQANSWAQLTPKKLYHDCLSKREGVLMHVKMLVGFVTKQGESEPDHGFLYLGSHNFTPSAWGRISGGKRSPLKLTISNHELGVVMKLDKDQLKDVDNIVPWKRPLAPYSRDDEPWIQSKVFG